MATNRNDDMNRNKTNTPNQGGLTPSHTTPGSKDVKRDNMGQTGRDPVNKDREMNRDTEVGQDSSGSGQSGRRPSDISE
jgi:hypothetical protein